MTNIKQIELEFILKEMKQVQKEHPKANVYYSWEDREIKIVYPLPKDFKKIINL